MATEMTPQEQAEDVYYGLQVMNAPEHNLRAADNERDVQAIVTLITETRRAALLEAAQVIPRNWLDPLLKGVRTSSCPEIEQLLQSIKAEIDRLAQEG